MEVSDASHLFVATPCYSGVVTQAYMESVFALAIEGAARGVRLSLAMLGQDALITRSRNTLLAQFRRSAASHLLFVDADIGFLASDVFRLLAHGREIVGGLYPVRAAFWDGAARDRLAQGEAPETASFRYVGEPCGETGSDGLLPARYAGTGFLLVARRAIDRLVVSYPETECRHVHVARNGDADGSETCHALFDCMIDPETRVYLSEDYAFCARWRRIGGKIWLDPSVTLSHHGMGEFRGVPSTRFGAARRKSLSEN